MANISSIKMDSDSIFKDILLPRNVQYGIATFMTREFKPNKTYLLEKIYTPQTVKEIAFVSTYLDAVIEAESSRTGKPKEKLKEEVRNFLEEIGFDRKMFIVRWVGVFFLNVCFMMKVGLFVNEPAVLKLKATMGKNPVLFLPTHRSYADFCLMTYLCYHYDIELPVTASGTDFLSMALVGRILRSTGAFYIRRSIAGAPLYAATLRQYVRTVVANFDSPVEFFLEGTRSRSNKSMAPKYGMLSMMLMALFAREVPDITIVPVNISYDRLMEQGLFAYEHLGVPKPKESTGGLIKALRTLNDHFGNIYINLGDPISVKDYLNNHIEHSEEMLKPLDQQQITSKQFQQVKDIGNYVIGLQQNITIVTITNLVSLVLMDSLVTNRLLTYDEVVSNVEWTIVELRRLGASVFERDVRSSVDRIMVVHNKMMMFDKDRRLRLVATPPMDVSSSVKTKMKGHTLKPETMAYAVPAIQLQININPVAHYLAPPAILSLIVARKAPNREQLSSDYTAIRKLLRYEFFYLEDSEESTFNKALDYCISQDVVSSQDGGYGCAGARDLRRLLWSCVLPALDTMLCCVDVVGKLNSFGHKEALKLIQERIESSNCHPYCLSLEAISNCLQGLVFAGALEKIINENDIIYTPIIQVLSIVTDLIKSVLPAEQNNNFGRNNCVMIEARLGAKL